MDSSGKYWLGFWGMVGTVICVCVFAITSCIQQTNDKNVQVIKESVAKGADPLAAKCAMLVGGTSNVTPSELAICMSAPKK